jgi:hypothetical protein
MGRGGAVIIGVILGLLASLVVIAIFGGGGGGGHHFVKTAYPVTISDVAGAACTINPAPITGLKSGVGDYVTWQQASNQPFTVTFPNGTVAFDTGSPFDNPLGSGWQTIFPSKDGSPVQTGQADRNLYEKTIGKHDFYIQTISVGGGVPCYDRGKNPIEGMKVHVD